MPVIKNVKIFPVINNFKYQLLIYKEEASITEVIMVTAFPHSKVHGANIGPIWGRQDPGGPHVGPMNFAI